MRRLSEIMGAALAQDVDIVGLTADSRAVAPGFLFAALVGTKADGRIFVPAAIANGAAAILAPEGSNLDLPPGIVLISDSNPRRRFALMAAAFHRTQPETMVAVTGTNGKTSTAMFYGQIMDALGNRACAMGTMGIMAKGWDNTGGLTTPDPVALHESLARLAEFGITHGCMEASSHGLDQHRLDGVRLKAAAFTNLTRDHLDYHQDMESYAKAKLRLFTEVLTRGGIAIINMDADPSQSFAKAAAEHGLTVMGYGKAAHDIRLIASTAQPFGQELRLEIMGRPFTVKLPLVGLFQAYNALAALGLALASDTDLDKAVAALENLTPVPGRMQKAAERANGAAIYVDYAHTPDALETVLKALKPHAVRRLVAVFGCGGERDQGKRPLMGKVACTLADAMIVTDDNPRSEDPALIRDSVRSACCGAIEIADRREAIRTAVMGLQTGDILLIAGKGHETGQIIGGEVLPFNDVEEARSAVLAADGGLS